MNIKLYHRWTCPQSAEVRDFIEANNLEGMIEYIDIEEDAKYRFDLKALTGKLKVPCLVVNGHPISETQIIFQWIKENLLHEYRKQVGIREQGPQGP
jgi:glutaredoxin